MALVVLAIAALLVLTALRDSIVFFNSPTDIVEKKVQAGSRIRLGGLVQPGSLERKNIDAVFDVHRWKECHPRQLSRHPAGPVS